MNHGRQHGRRLGTVTLNVTKTVQCAWLIVVIPEQRVPAAAGLHTQRPVVQNLLQLGKTERHLRPLLAVLVVHLQVVEAEHHIQLVVRRVGVAHAVLDAGRGHFAHGHGVVILTEGGAVHLLNTGVHNRGVGVLCLVHGAFGSVEQLLALADDVNDVKAETAHTLLVPEVHDLKQLVAHSRVVPVHVSLGAVVQVHVEQGSAVLIRVLAKAGPAGAAELRLPIGRFTQLTVLGVFARANVEVVPVFALTGECALEPLVLGRNMVEHHVEHNAHTVLGEGGNHLFDILHGAQVGVNGVVVGDVVAVVVLRGGEERVEPHHVHVQGGNVGHLLDDTAQVAVGATGGGVEGLGVHLVDDGGREVLAACRGEGERCGGCLCHGNLLKREQGSAPMKACINQCVGNEPRRCYICCYVCTVRPVRGGHSSPPPPGAFAA